MPCGAYHLKVVRLPISPPGRLSAGLYWGGHLLSSNAENRELSSCISLKRTLVLRASLEALGSAA